MNILMLTNTYAPHVGGVARSVEGFAGEFRKLGHRVVIAAPIFDGAPKEERDVIRFPAMQRFNGSDFSVPLPVPGKLSSALRKFPPAVVHSHHPFLLGDTALRVAAGRKIPIVFTHHTLYEKFTHYVPGDSAKMKRFIVELVTGYCNLCDGVIAPSRSVAELLRLRGVKTRIATIPTGVDLEAFGKGDGRPTRCQMPLSLATWGGWHRKRTCAFSREPWRAFSCLAKTSTSSLSGTDLAGKKFKRSFPHSG
jgi:glycosyltransferase involved in cell wall biosynthesis